MRRLPSLGAHAAHIAHQLRVILPRRSVGGSRKSDPYGLAMFGMTTVTTVFAAGEALAISVPAGETRVLKHFQAPMPYGSSCRMFRDGA